MFVRATIIFAFSEVQSTCDKNLVNKTFSDVMNAAMSHKYHSITFSGEITSRKNHKNFIMKIHNFILENVPRNLKFTIFHADDINSIKMFKRILQKIY